MATRRKATQSHQKSLIPSSRKKTDMDTMTLTNMLSFLDGEEALLTQLQIKITEELSRLQVEEHVFLHALKIIGEKQDGTSTSMMQANGDQGQNLSKDQNMVDALNMALQDIGEPDADNMGEGENVDTG